MAAMPRVITYEEWLDMPVVGPTLSNASGYLPITRNAPSDSWPRSQDTVLSTSHTSVPRGIPTAHRIARTKLPCTPAISESPSSVLP
jgi:hypothetical protein